jgi:hypothetical protein
MATTSNMLRYAGYSSKSSKELIKIMAVKMRINGNHYHGASLCSDSMAPEGVKTVKLFFGGYSSTSLSIEFSQAILLACSVASS